MAARLSFLFVRNLTYKIIYDRKKPSKVTSDLNYYEKMMISGIAGAVGAAATNPLEIIKIRTISDLGRPSEFTRGYVSLADGFARIGEETPGMFRGVGANMLRAFVINSVMIYPYNAINEHMYNAFGDVFTNRIAALLAASVFGTAIGLPFDHVCTKMLNQYGDKTLNRVTYSGVFDCTMKTINVEGMNAFWVGAYPFYLKTLIYASTTIYFSDWVTTGLKRSSGLAEKYI